MQKLSSIILRGELAIDHKLNIALNQATSIITKVTPEIQKLAVEANGAIKTITASETDGVFSLIAKEVPAGAAIEAAVLTILNRYAPYLQAAANDATILEGVQKYAIAELTKLFDNSEKDIDVILNCVIKFLESVGL